MLDGEEVKGKRTNLIGVDHEHIALVIPNDTSGQLQSLPVLLHTRPHLQLEMLVPLIHSLFQQSLDLRSVISKPTRTRSVCRYTSIILRLLNPLLLPYLRLLQHLQRLLRRQRISNIPEIDTPYNLFGRHISHNSPHRFSQNFPP